MPLTQFIPIRYILFLVLGIVLGNFSFGNNLLGFWISGLSLIFLAWIHLSRKRRGDLSFEILTAICLVGVGISAMALQIDSVRPDHYSRQRHDSALLRLQIQETLRSSSYNNRFIAKVIAVNETLTCGKILLYTPDSVIMEPDSELLVSTAWKPIRGPMNPGQFDFRSYMAQQGIYDEIRLSRNDHIILPGDHPTLMGQLRILRRDMGDRLLEAGLSTATVATTEALLLGQRKHLDAGLYDAYKDAGAVHILAVSGLHIGILVLILKFLFQPFRRIRYGNLGQFLITLTFLWAYAFFTGMSPSVVRAVALFSFIGYAWMIHRPTNMYNTLALSFFFVLLIIQPAYLFQVGFQMSYAAVLAIIWIYPKLMRFWRPQSYILKRLWQLTAVSLSAQLGVLPISLYYFHQFPGLFFLSNLLILPFLGCVLGMGILVTVLTQFGWNLHYLITTYDVLIRTMNKVVEWIGSQEIFIFRDIGFDLPSLVLVYGCIITFVLFLERRGFKRLVTLTGFALLLQSWVFFKTWQQHRAESLYIMHSVKHSILLEQSGMTYRLYSGSFDLPYDGLIRDFQLESGTGAVIREVLHNVYTWKDKRILIIDASGLVPENQIGYTHILLTQSPRIHLDRILEAFPSAKIIADGSNYPSFIKRWQESCIRLKRSFHYTGEDGAYRFEGR